MEMKAKSLKEWYGSINEEDMLPNGVIQLKLPVIDAVPEQEPEVQIQVSDQEVKKEISDPVVLKDREVSLKAFVLAKRIQDSLIKLSEMIDPYQSGSEERNKTSAYVKELYRELGEEIASL